MGVGGGEWVWVHCLIMPNINIRKNKFLCEKIMVVLDGTNIQESSINQAIIRSSRPVVFCKKGVLRNFTKFTGKHLCQ